MTFLINPYVSFPAAGGPFSPDDIAGLSLWLDADDPATITASGSSLTAWTDKSSAGNDCNSLSNLTTGTATLNGRNVISHNGFNTSYAQTPWPVPTVACSWFIVWDIGADNNFVALPTNDTGDFVGAAANGSTAASNSDMGTPSVWVDGVSFSGNRNALYLLMTANATVFSATGVVAKAAVTSYRTSYTSGVDFPTLGGLAEVLCYTGSLGTTDRQSVETYLANKWGL